MALADDILALRDRTLAELDAIHDYVFDSRFAWRLVEDHIAAGPAFGYTNPATGTTTTEQGLLAKVQEYRAARLLESTFVQFHATFESFVADLIRVWLLARPEQLRPEGKGDEEMTVRLSAILAAVDKDALLRDLVGRKVNAVLYGRPARWFAYLRRLAKVPGPAAADLARLAEMKAARDVLAHNRGVAEAQYLEKAGPHARAALGERIEITDDYHQETWALLRTVVAESAAAAAATAA